MALDTDFRLAVQNLECPRKLWGGLTITDVAVQERICIELMTSDRKLKVSREGKQGLILGYSVVSFRIWRRKLLRGCFDITSEIA